MRMEYAKPVAGVLKNMQPRPVSCVSTFAILSKIADSYAVMNRLLWKNRGGVIMPLKKIRLQIHYTNLLIPLHCFISK